jgi:DNA-directed RNA polymerase specialized sigma24 family protein
MLGPTMNRSASTAALRAVRESLVAISRRHSRLAAEVEDVAHDIILSALRRGTTLESDAFLRGAHAAARRHAAFLARSAGRRRAREARSAHDAGVSTQSSGSGDTIEGAPLSALSPGLRTTLLLLAQGLEKAELLLALGLSDAALRKRFQALREHGPLARPELAISARTPAQTRLRRSQVELLPRLATALPGQNQPRRVLAASDPDGHGFIFVEALTSGSSTATPCATERAHTKGNPC